MTKRQELLKSLRRRLQGIGLIAYKYGDTDDNYCAIGWLAHEIGIQDDVIRSARSCAINQTSRRGVVTIADALEKAGFTRTELKAIQQANDRSMPRRIENALKSDTETFDEYLVERIHAEVE